MFIRFIIMPLSPNNDVAGVDYLLPEHVYLLPAHVFDVRDVDCTLPEPEIYLAEVEIDVSDIDFGNSGRVRTVRDLVHTLVDHEIDVGDVDRMLRGHVYLLRRMVFDVAGVDSMLREADNGLMQRENESPRRRSRHRRTE